MALARSVRVGRAVYPYCVDFMPRYGAAIRGAFVAAPVPAERKRPSMSLSPLSRRLSLMVGLSMLALTPTVEALAQGAPAAPAPLSSLVAKVDIPYEEFRLPNGLRVIVHTDRKAPVVAVSIWYHVGSRFEPAGKTGFAHLFEHLMFYGSENADGPFFGRLEDIGATDWNGTTWFDRTNYFETVPTGALDRALFLESDRMGHLLGAVTQTKLDTQRGVVQNEKRMGENEPYGLVEYAQLAALLPEGHPYRHSTIGSMADLNAASLADVQTWFKTHYGPNNAVLVLAGDIDVATAKAKVGKWFGNIQAGPAPADVDATVPTLPKDAEVIMHDNVAATRLYRNWIVPGVNPPTCRSWTSQWRCSAGWRHPASTMCSSGTRRSRSRSRPASSRSRSCRSPRLRWT